MLLTNIPLDVIVDPIDEITNEYGTLLAVGCAVAAVMIVTLLILLVRKKKK